MSDSEYFGYMADKAAAKKRAPYHVEVTAEQLRAEEIKVERSDASPSVIAKVREQIYDLLRRR